MKDLIPVGWLVVEASTQKEVDERLRATLSPSKKTALVIKGVSERIDLSFFLPQTSKAECEPELLPFYNAHMAIGFVCVSGGSAPVHPAWVRSLRDQCQVAVVPFYFAGYGEWAINTMMPAERICVGVRWEEGMPDGVANEIIMYKVGASRSGRLLDGKEWLQVPEGVKVS